MASKAIKLHNVRLAFPDLWTPKPFQGSGEPRWTATGLFPADHPAAKLVSAEIKRVATEKWGAGAENMLKELKAKEALCLRKGDSKLDKNGEPQQGFAGMLYVSASATPPKDPPPVIMDVDGVTRLDATAGRPYGGCYVNLYIEVWAQANQYGRRVNAKLKGVQFLRDGDAFGGGAPLSPDMFEDESGGLADDGGDFDDELV